jgi:hypothetical protein
VVLTMPKHYIQDEVLAVIRKEVEATSLRKTAERIGISAPFLSDVLRGNRLISETVAEAFGFERKIETVTTVTFTFRKRAA